MKKIIVLTKDDFTDPQKADQYPFTATLKHDDMAQIEQEFDVIIYERKLIKNRFGGLDADLDTLI